jgi:ABC-type lipoprotein release transport system permease subunit
MIKLAWRNLWRRKRRTLITGFSIGFGVLLSVTFTGTGDYAYTNMIDAGASMGYGHVTIEPVGYNQTPALDKRIGDTAALKALALTQPEAKGAIVRILGQGMFATARKSVGGSFFGIDPQQESPAYNLLLRSITQGAVFDDTHGRGVVIGSKMAEQLDLALGKKLVYTTTDAHGDIVSEAARVSGIFHTGISEVDSAVVMLPIDRLRKVLDYASDEATMVAVILDDQRRANRVRDRLQQAIGDRAEVLSWRQTQPDLAGIINIDRSSNYVSQFLIGLLIAAGILNTLLMSVLERTREFGVMMAIGMTPGQLFRLVMTESFWLACFGLLLGALITAPWFWYLVEYGLDFSATIGEDYSAGGVLIDPIMHIRLFPESIVAILVGVFGLAMLSGIYPAWRAGRIPPVESLKAL